MVNEMMQRYNFFLICKLFLSFLSQKFVISQKFTVILNLENMQTDSGQQQPKEAKCFSLNRNL